MGEGESEARKRPSGNKINEKKFDHLAQMTTLDKITSNDT